MKVAMITLFCLSSYLLADVFDRHHRFEHETRRWVGKNGHTLYASFFSKLDEDKINLITDGGKILEIAFDNLSEADQRYVTELLEGKAEAEKLRDEIEEAGERVTEGIKPDVDVDAASIPRWEEGQEPVELKNTALGVWTGLMGWRKSDFLQLPTEGDDEKQGEWLERVIERKLGYDQGDVLSLRDLSDKLPGFLKYCYGDVAGFRLFNASNWNPDANDALLAEISDWVKYSHLAVFQMNVESDGRNDFTTGGLVESVDDQGGIVVHINGKRAEGKLLVIESEPHRVPKLEIKFSNLMDLPDSCRSFSSRFRLWGDNHHGGMLFLRAYRYSAEGSPAKLPQISEVDSFKWRTVVGE